MHRTDDDANVANKFDPGDPLVPRQPTQVSADWLNAVQEELINFLLQAGITPIKGTWTQVFAAVNQLFVDRATGVMSALNVASSLLAASGAFVDVGGTLRANAEIRSAVDYATAVAVNEITGRAIHKAHASIVLNNTATPDLDAADSYNVTSVGVSASILTVTCTSLGGHFLASGAALNAVVTLGDEMGGTLYHARVVSHTRDSVTIKIRDNSGTLMDPAGATLNGLRVFVHMEGKQ